LKINDKFTRGWVAGTCGGLLGGLFSFLLYSVGLSTLRLTDWTAILVFGRTPPFSFFDELYALGVLAGSLGGVGILFAFLLPAISEKMMYFKGWIIFLVPWGIIYFLTALAKTEGTLNLPVMTTLSNGISTSIIGLASVCVYRALEPKSKSK
jgi:hypothetical protein